MKESFVPANSVYGGSWINPKGVHKKLNFDGPVIVLDCYDGPPRAQGGYLLGPNIGKPRYKGDQGMSFIVAPTRTSRATVVYFRDSEAELCLVYGLDDDDDDDDEDEDDF